MNPLETYLKGHGLLSEFTIINNIDTTQHNNKLCLIMPSELIINKGFQQKSFVIRVPKNNDYSCAISNLLIVLDTLNVSRPTVNNYIINFTYSKESINFNSFDASGNYIHEVNYLLKYTKRS